MQDLIQGLTTLFFDSTACIYGMTDTTEPARASVRPFSPILTPSPPPPNKKEEERKKRRMKRRREKNSERKKRRRKCVKQ